MAITKEWAERKASALATAWQQRFGETPSKHAVVLALAVATAETRAGDAWEGEFNWGATTLRSLNAAELAALRAAGITPTVGPGHQERAKQAMQTLADAGLPLPQGVIHCDSKTQGTQQVPYFVFFRKGADDVDGANYFLKLLADGKPARVVLENPKGSAYQLAAAMYSKGYFWGRNTHDTPEGNAKNVDDYATWIGRLVPGLEAALKDWAPADPLPAIGDEPYDGPGEGTSRPQGEEPALIPLELDRAELEMDRDRMIREKDE